MADASDPPTTAPEGGVSLEPIDRRFADEAESGGSFVVGLLAGTVLGAGLAMIFGPQGSLSRGETRPAAEAPTAAEHDDASADRMAEDAAS